MKHHFLKQMIHFIVTSLACAAILFTVPLPENGAAGSGEQEFWQEGQEDNNNEKNSKLGIDPLHDRDSFDEYPE